MLCVALTPCKRRDQRKAHHPRVDRRLVMWLLSRPLVMWLLSTATPASHAADESGCSACSKCGSAAGQMHHWLRAASQMHHWLRRKAGDADRFLQCHWLTGSRRSLVKPATRWQQRLGGRRVFKLDEPLQQEIIQASFVQMFGTGGRPWRWRQR